jgi:hypothetical protein
MPMYSSRCDECGKAHSYLSTVANRATTPTCHGEPTSKTLDAPMVSAMAWSGWKGFNVPGGQWIEDGASYKKFLDKHNYVPASEGNQEASIQRANKEAADDKKLEAAVTQAVLTHNT